MNNIRKNQIKRGIRKERRKRLARIKLAVFTLLSVFVIGAIYISATNNQNAQADTVQVSNELKKDEYEGTRYSDAIVKYMRVNQESDVYESVSGGSSITFKVKNGDYVEYYGEENTWAKIGDERKVGYISADKLEDLDSDELVVMNGYLMDGKNYTFPEDYKTVLNAEAQNSMLVMIEAMNREGYKIDIARLTMEESKDEETLDEILSEDVSDEELENIPNYSNHTLRSGSSVEFKLPENDSSNSFENSNQGKWLKNNAHNYGFILRYPKGSESITGFRADEKIYRYVGVNIATDMYENDMTLEEYFGL